LNCIDALAGDDSLIELRKRRPILRKLERVEEAQRAYEDQWTKDKEEAEVAAADKLKEAQGRLDEAVRKIQEDKSMDDQAKEVRIVEVQQKENRSFEVEKAKIDEAKNARLEQATHDRNAARARIHNTYRISTLVFGVLPGLLLGVVMFLRRSSRAAAIVPASRQVSGHHRTGHQSGHQTGHHAGHGGVK
jgi:ABC-2 type transport system permease protein